jgi:Uma2 family endonuclease
MALSLDTVREFLAMHYPDYGYEIRNGEFVLEGPTGVRARRSFGNTLQLFLEQTRTGYDYEIRDGEYVLVAPNDIVASNTAGQFFSILNAWAKPRKLGTVTESNGGFIFEDGDLLAPDVAFISVARMPTLPDVYARGAPEIAVQIRSSSDREKNVREKLARLLAKGSIVAIYIEPRSHQFEILRAGREPEIFQDGDTVTIPDVLPGFSFSLVDLWP